MTQEKAASVAKFGIVAIILKVLGMDDEGKVSKFFAKEVKKFETAIRNLNNNITAAKNVYQATVDALNDKLEDAKESVEAAWQSVTIDKLTNNDAMESFAPNFWAKVDRAEKAVKTIEEALKDEAKKHEEVLKDFNEQIAKYQARIDKIKA